MAYNPVCKICDNLIISQAVTFADGTLTINLPAGSYNRGRLYCIVVAQAIPAETTITAPVVLTLGDGTEDSPAADTDRWVLVAKNTRSAEEYVG